MDTSLAPGYIRQTYDGTLFPHHMVCPVNVDVAAPAGIEPDITLKDASTIGAIAGWAAYLAVIKLVFPATCHFGLAEIHTVDPDTGEDRFIFAWNAGVVGSAGGVQSPMTQEVFSFKTSLGSAYKLYLMEPTTLPNIRLLPPFTDAPNSTISDFVVSGASPVYGRQNAYPFVPVSLITKTNDKLRKQQGRA